MSAPTTLNVEQLKEMQVIFAEDVYDSGDESFDCDAYEAEAEEETPEELTVEKQRAQKCAEANEMHRRHNLPQCLNHPIRGAPKKCKCPDDLMVQYPIEYRPLFMQFLYKESPNVNLEELTLIELKTYLNELTTRRNGFKDGVFFWNFKNTTRRDPLFVKLAEEQRDYMEIEENIMDDVKDEIEKREKKKNAQEETKEEEEKKNVEEESRDDNQLFSVIILIAIFGSIIYLNK